MKKMISLMGLALVILTGCGNEDSIDGTYECTSKRGDGKILNSNFSLVLNPDGIGTDFTGATIKWKKNNYGSFTTVVGSGSEFEYKKEGDTHILHILRNVTECKKQQQ